MPSPIVTLPLVTIAVLWVSMFAHDTAVVNNTTSATTPPWVKPQPLRETVDAVNATVDAVGATVDAVNATVAVVGANVTAHRTKTHTAAMPGGTANATAIMVHAAIELPPPPPPQDAAAGNFMVAWIMVTTCVTGLTLFTFAQPPPKVVRLKEQPPPPKVVCLKEQPPPPSPPPPTHVSTRDWSRVLRPRTPGGIVA